MNTMNDSIEKKCYFDYLVKKYTMQLFPQIEQEQKARYNTERVLMNTQSVAEKVVE